MVEQRRASDNTGAGASPTPASLLLRRQRRMLDRPANDNVPSLGQRILRAVVFVAIGGVIAWLLRNVLG